MKIIEKDDKINIKLMGGLCKILLNIQLKKSSTDNIF